MPRVSESSGQPPGSSPPQGVAPSQGAPPQVRRLGVEVQGRVDDYLVRVDSALTRVGASPTERRTVGLSLRNQIMQKLTLRAASKAAGGGSTAPTLNDADAVLAELGPPEAHLKDAWGMEGGTGGAAMAGVAGSASPQAAGASKLSLTALIGAIWATLFPLMLGLSSIPIKVAGGQPPVWQTILQLITVPLGWSAPFATTVLGLMAIGRIQKSEGHLRGLSLALFDALLFPMLLLDFLVFWLCWHLTDQLVAQEAITPPIAKLINQALPTVAVVLGDYFIAVRAWVAVQPRRVRRRR